jgi:enediyne biosynthesis protein E4
MLLSVPSTKALIVHSLLLVCLSRAYLQSGVRMGAGNRVSLLSTSQLASRNNSPLFAEIAAQAGLSFRHYNGMTGKLYLPEIMGPGAALVDFDNDGDLDVYLVQGTVLDPGSRPNNTLDPWRQAEPPSGRLYRNNLKLERGGVATLQFTDVTAKSGIMARGYGMGVAVGDINNDGWPDLYLSNLGGNQLYVNRGDGTFRDATVDSGTDDPRWSTGAAFFDFDRDGWLDLMVGNYADFSVTDSPKCYAVTTVPDYCGPRAFRTVGNRLFHNNHDGTFTNVTSSSGVATEFGHALGIVTADFNDDGWIDIYVANDGDPNQLWINQQNGTFRNEALLAGAAVNRDGQAEAGMGVDAGDFDGNGSEDIFITHLMEETHTLYVNLGKDEFEDRTRESGVGLPGTRFTGFGTLFFDYDNDGWLDLLVANGAVRRQPELMAKKDPYPLGQPNQLFHNDGKGRFSDVSQEAGAAFQLLEVSRGAAFGDIDNDGDTDVLITNNNGPARLLLNQVGSRNHWLGLRLIGGVPGRDMLGARIEVVTANNRVLRRRVRTDGSYLSANDPRVLLGLAGAEGVSVVRVLWPDGRRDEWRTLPIDRYLTLNEGEAPEPK